jgi:hypothetical protein
MNFYKIDLQLIGESKYAWASGYGPIANHIDNIPFLKNTPERFKQTRLKSWEICNDPPGATLDSTGKKWPDVLGCGQGSPFFFFSEKILVDLRDAGISYLRATEMPLIQPFPKKLRETEPPVYYVL